MRTPVKTLVEKASRVTSLPVLRWASPAVPLEISEAQVQGFLTAQNLAREAVLEVASLLRPGWTEQQAAALVDTYLMDVGVGAFFHKAFAWFGERTRFDGIRNYAEFSPSPRVLQEEEVYLLDVAPIYRGFICDIGYTGCVGDSPEYRKSITFLWELRDAIPGLFQEYRVGADIFREIERRIQDAGYECAHRHYPFAVLGHRVFQTPRSAGRLSLWNFGWQSYFELLSRGVFGQLFNQHYHGDLRGLWAIEPHIGANGFGAKFEEILWVTTEGARWIAPKESACLPEKP